MAIAKYQNGKKRVSFKILASLAILLMFSATSSDAFEIFGKKFFEPAQEETTVVDPVRYSVSLTQTGLSDADEAQLRSASELIAGEGFPVSGSLGLLIKAKADRDLLIAALYEQARYAALVRVFIQGTEIRNIETTKEFDTATTVPVELRVKGGRQFKFGRVRFVGDDTNLSPSEFGLSEAQPAYSYLILQAQENILAQLRNSGHPFAQVTSTNVEANHKTGTLDVDIRVYAGPTATLGDVSVVGNQDVDREFIIEQAAIIPGSQYSPERISDIRKRLLQLGVFSSVIVDVGENLNGDGQVTLIIKVKERKQRYLGVGTTYSNSEGFGIEGYWGHRNLFGRAGKLRVDGSISRIGEARDLAGLNYSAGFLYEQPGFYDPASTFSAAGRAVSENYNAFERRSVRGRVGVSHKFDARSKIFYALDVDLSRIVEEINVSRHLIISAPIEYAYDGSDDRFNPTTGSRLLLQLEPSYDLKSSAGFIKAKASVAGYYSPVQNLTIAGRTALGSIYGASLESVPADRRFYAGGGGSVRGYAFQAIGPHDLNMRPTGGLSLFEASLEGRIWTNETFGIVPFIDAGTVSTSQFPDFSDLRFGAGIGIRYQTPFGPLRLDVGIPLNRRDGEDRWGIYAGIGQAF